MAKKFVGWARGAKRAAGAADDVADAGRIASAPVELPKVAPAGKTVGPAPESVGDIPVIGRQYDTAIARDWAGHRILDDPDWTIAKNDAWIQDIIKKRQRVYTGSPTNRPNIWDAINNRETVYGRELRQLQEAGYTWDGDYLVPPAM